MPVIFIKFGATTFHVPADWNSADNSVICIGHGGWGGQATGSGGCSAGGGGGAFAQSNNIVLTPGATINVGVFTSGVYFNATSLTNAATNGPNVSVGADFGRDDANAAAARGTLGVDAAGTDNSTNVTLAGSYDYLTLSGQQITLGQIDLATDVTGALPLANGGLGVSLSDPNADRIAFWDDSAGNVAWLAQTNGIEISGTNLQMTTNQRTREIVCVIDGGGSAITTGVKTYLPIDFAGTITQVTMVTDQTGSIVVDVWKDTYANFPPTDADSITASAPVTISSATKAQDATLTGWTTAISAGDVLGFNVDSASTVTKATLTIKVTCT
jgi:hypothetical protein